MNIATFYTADHYLAVSTTFSRGAGMLVGVVAPEHVAANAYWQKVKPIFDWQFMLVLGIPLGAYPAARLSRCAVTFSGALADMWARRCGKCGWRQLVPRAKRHQKVVCERCLETIPPKRDMSS